MSEKKEEIEGRGKRRNCRHKFRARKHSSVPDRGDKEKLRVTTIALKSDGKKKSVGGREREREGGGEREALVGGQRSLEFHTWINSPSSGECTPPPRPTSSRFPTPARARGLGATTNSEIHPVQPLMNVRAACDITFPPPISIDTLRYTYKGSAWQPATWTIKSRTKGGGGGGRASRAHRIKSPSTWAFPPSLCVHPSRNSSWLQIKPSVKYYTTPSHSFAPLPASKEIVPRWTRRGSWHRGKHIDICPFFFFSSSPSGQIPFVRDLHLWTHFSRKFFYRRIDRYRADIPWTMKFANFWINDESIDSTSTYIFAWNIFTSSSCVSSTSSFNVIQRILEYYSCTSLAGPQRSWNVSKYWSFGEDSIVRWFRVWKEENLENEPPSRSKSVLNKDELKAELRVSPMTLFIWMRRIKLESIWKCIF